MSRNEIELPSHLDADTDLPEGWTAASIAHLCDVPREKGRVGVVPYLEIGNIDIESKQYTLTSKPSVKGCITARRTDVLVSRVRPTRGAVTWVQEHEVEVSSAFTILRNLGALADGYLWLYLSHNQQFFNYLGEHSTGTMYPTTSDAVVSSFAVPLAPLAEQKRIVMSAERLLESVNATRARLTRAPAILKRFRQSVLAGASSGRLTSQWRDTHICKPASSALAKAAARVDPKKISRLTRRGTKGLPETEVPRLPATWEVYSVRQLVERGAIFDFQDGNHGNLYPRKTDFGPVGVKFLTAAQVHDNRVLLEDAPLLLHEKAKQLRIGFALAGDVLLTHNATVGRVAVLPPSDESVILGTSVTYYRSNPEVLLPQYLCYAMQGQFWQDQLRRVMEQTTRNQVSVTKQVEFLLLVPPPEEQLEIVRRVDAMLTLGDRIEDHVRAATIRAEQLPRAILVRAFRGDLVPAEAQLAAEQGREYEPASVLLERVQQLRKQQKPNKRGRGGKKVTKRSGRQSAKNRKPLAEVLREQGKPLTPERLFDLAGFDENTVDEFYEQLRRLIQEGTVRERRPNQKDVTLEAMVA